MAITARALFAAIVLTQRRSSATAFVRQNFSLELAIDRPGWLVDYQQDNSTQHFPRLVYNSSLETRRRCTTPAFRTDCEWEDAVTLFFHGLEGGIALELGGLDGVKLSETLYLEEVHRWKRVIVDANPIHRESRERLAPDVVGVTSAICSAQRMVHFVGIGNVAISGIAEFMSGSYLRTHYKKAHQKWNANNMSWEGLGLPHFQKLFTTVHEVPCVPLGLVLKHIGLQWIHFALLDTEGAELDILHTIDWRHVKFGVLVIEVASPTGSRPKTYCSRVVRFMLSQATHHQYRLVSFTSAKGTSQGLGSAAGRVRGRNLWFMHVDFVGRARAPSNPGGSRTGSLLWQPAGTTAEEPSAEHLDEWTKYALGCEHVNPSTPGEARGRGEGEAAGLGGAERAVDAYEPVREVASECAKTLSTKVGGGC